MIVGCAGCGKRFKGAPDARKYKCSVCGNLYTFPPSARAPAPGHVFCSNCWLDLQVTPELKSCPACSQTISPAIGGVAVEDQPGQTMRLKADTAMPPPGGVAAVARPVTKAAPMTLEAAEARARAAEAKLQAYRQAALGALEPLVPEYKQAMRELHTAAEDLADLAAQARDHLQAADSPSDRLAGLSEVQRIEAGLNDLLRRLESVEKNLGARLSEVLGGRE